MGKRNEGSVGQLVVPFNEMGNRQGGTCYCQAGTRGGVKPGMISVWGVLSL